MQRDFDQVPIPADRIRVAASALLCQSPRNEPINVINFIAWFRQIGFTFSNDKLCRHDAIYLNDSRIKGDLQVKRGQIFHVLYANGDSDWALGASSRVGSGWIHKQGCSCLCSSGSG